MRCFRLLSLALALCASRLVPAQPIGADDRENTAPTPWFTYAGQTPADIANAVGQGMRPTDLKVDNPALLTFTVCYVPNIGPYQKPFWWLVAVDQPTLQGFVQANNAIITNLTAWQGGGGTTLFAATLEPNVFRRTWWWYYDITAAAFFNNAVALGARPTSISQYARNGGPAFAGVLVLNVGLDHRTWWMYHGISKPQMDGFLVQNGARLWTLLPDGNGLLTCVMIANPALAWWYATGVTGPQLIAFANARGARVMDALATGVTVTGVMIGNGAIAVGRVGLLMRQISDGIIGYYLKEVNGVVVDTFNERFVFEPASVLKTLHHFHAIDQVRLGAINLNTPINVFLAAQGSCPQDLNPVQEQLGQVLARMMQVSDNNRTQAIVARFGQAPINGTALALGMLDTSVNHRIGCLGPIPNTLTLHDIGLLHEQVANGALGNETANFRNLMLRDVGGYGLGSLQNVVNQEAIQVGLNAQQLAGFVGALRITYKDGVYSFLNGMQHRAWAAWLSVPHRIGGQVQGVEYVTGVFLNGGSNFMAATAAANLGAGEVVRPALNRAMQTWLGGVVGVFQPFGFGCPGSNRVPPLHAGVAPNQSPTIGMPVSYQIAGAPANRFAAVQFGSSNQVWNGIPLPLRLDFLGMRGCLQWIAPDFQAFVFTDVTGFASLDLMLPNNPALVGAQFHTQGLIVDPPAPGGAITTNGLTTMVGG